jgi:hypothetical protein
MGLSVDMWFVDPSNYDEMGKTAVIEKLDNVLVSNWNEKREWVETIRSVLGMDNLIGYTIKFISNQIALEKWGSYVPDSLHHEPTCYKDKKNL